MFDLTVDNGAYIYTIAEDSPWRSLVLTQVGERYQSAVEGIELRSDAAVGQGTYTFTANILISEDDREVGKNYVNPTKFVADAKAYYEANNTAIDAEAIEMIGNASGHPTASDLDYGYYFVNTEMGALINVNSANAAVTAKGIGDMPFDKEITNLDNTNTANVGDTVNYRITSEVPETKDHLTYTYVIKDNLDDGLTLDNSSVKVYLGPVGEGTEITNSSSVVKTNPTENGFVLTFDMKALTANGANVGSVLRVEYTAVINENAVSEVEWNNASLTYTKGTKTETLTDKEYVYVYKLVIDKTDGGSNKLAGAEFALKNSNAGESFGKYYAVDENGVVSWVDSVDDATKVITLEDGSAEFAGLAAGTYALEEITAPNGYNKLDGDVTVTLSQLTAEEAQALKDGSATLTANRLVDTEEVANYSGNLLPETGGIGTTIFYIAGAVLVIGASVLLITRRRMAK